MALFWRIWAAVSVVNLAVLAIFVGLATLQFDQIHSALVGERLVVLADRTAAPFLAAARINLPLSSVRNAAALLERARQADDAIKAIHVFDADGRILHSTEAEAPAAIPPVAVAARAEAAALPWYRETESGFLSSIDIPGSGGQSAGGILVVYPSRGSTIAVRAMGAELALAAILVLGVVSALSGILLRITLNRQISDFEMIDQAIVSFERDSWRSAAFRTAPEDVAEDAGDLRALLEAANRNYRIIGKGAAAAGTDAAP
jgi:hypothetical protein